MRKFLGDACTVGASLNVEVYQPADAVNHIHMCEAKKIEFPVHHTRDHEGIMDCCMTILSTN